METETKYIIKFNVQYHPNEDGDTTTRYDVSAIQHVCQDIEEATTLEEGLSGIAAKPFDTWTEEDLSNMDGFVDMTTCTGIYNVVIEEEEWEIVEESN